MSKNPLFWYVSMAVTAFGWIIFVLGLLLGAGGAFKSLWIVLALIFLVIHPLEIPIGMKVGERAGLEKGISALKTLAFGLTWWIPVKMGVIHD
ncbi:hypothetical protein [Desulfatibacillum aliphaticivorans]|uniref:hypothetical protein n=1 Tax=Desulfatibacillum aliphaticivorans TaxID=218208 RepID=UPI0003F662C5|nr:hypothetical protein [Desulfatibacillum aliphaticivorans]